MNFKVCHCMLLFITLVAGVSLHHRLKTEPACLHVRAIIDKGVEGYAQSLRLKRHNLHSVHRSVESRRNGYQRKYPGKSSIIRCTQRAHEAAAKGGLRAPCTGVLLVASEASPVSPLGTTGDDVASGSESKGWKMLPPSTA